LIYWQKQTHSSAKKTLINKIKINYKLNKHTKNEIYKLFK
jgi:hypothetical protein